jgi:sugar phosphate isomerase/epimerase
LARHAESLGRSILLEPLNRYESNVLPQQVDGARIVRAVGGAGIRLMSDVFHMHIEEPDLPAAIRACSDVIGHVHLADNTRKEPGSGCLDFRSVLRALRDTGYSGFLAFECGLTGPPDEVLPRSVAYLRALIA